MRFAGQRPTLPTHGGVNVRHGTDFYQFDGGETIQPELIDMCRWLLTGVLVCGDCGHKFWGDPRHKGRIDGRAAVLTN